MIGKINMEISVRRAAARDSERRRKTKTKGGRVEGKLCPDKTFASLVSIALPRDFVCRLFCFLACRKVPCVSVSWLCDKASSMECFFSVHINCCFINLHQIGYGWEGEPEKRVSGWRAIVSCRKKSENSSSEGKHRTAFSEHKHRRRSWAEL